MKLLEKLCVSVLQERVFISLERQNNMPKLKTNKGLAKRVRISKNGKIKRFRSGRRHLLSHKNSKARRRLRTPTGVFKTFAKSIKAVLHQ
jgi:large subunit ribosomal protein L35